MSEELFSPVRRLLGVPAILASFFLIAGVQPAGAQESAIRGRVVEEGSARPISGVHVAVVGTEAGALTDPQGRFEIVVNRQRGSTVRLRAQVIGYSTQTLEVTAGATDVVFRLSARAIELNQLVVTGTVGAAEVRSVGHSVSQVNATKMVEQSGFPDVGSLLKGAASGVSVMSSTGTVGSGTKIEIRGMSSFSLSSNPLVYVDGVRVNNDVATGPAVQCCASGVVSRLDDFDPEDIRSIEIVKGPAAATLYGTEATAGVIQIITKTGEGSTSGPHFDVKVSQGAARLTGLRNIIPTNYQLNDDGQLITTHALDQLDGSPFRTAHSQKYNASVRGGGDDVNYYSSVNGDILEGVDPVNVSRRLSGRVNLSFTPNPTWSVRESLGVTVGSLDLSPDTDVWPALLFARPTLLNTPRNGFSRAPPDIARQAQQNVQGYRRVTSSFRVQHSPFDLFEQQLLVGADVTSENSETTVERMGPELREWYTGSSAEGRRSVDRRDLTVLTFDYHGTLSLDLSEALSSETSVGAQYFLQRAELTSATGRNFPASGVDVLSAAGVTFGSDDILENKTIGLFAQQRFNYDDRLYFTAGLRADDNSAFGKDYSFVAYPKFSLSWIAKEDAPDDLVNSLRLRAAYGESGRQPQALAALRSYRSVPTSLGGSAISPRFIGNPDLSPELGREIELGVDAGLWGDRLSATGTYYRTWVKDAILLSPISPSTGFSGVQYLNLGKINKQGFEFSLEAQPVNTENLTWDAGLSLSFNDGEVVDVGGRDQIGIQGGSGSGTVFHRKGYPPGSWFYYRVVSAELNEAGEAVNIMCDGGPGNAPVPCSVDAPKVYYGPSSPRYQGSLTSSLTLSDRIEIAALVDFNADFYAYDFHKVYRCIYYTICKANYLPKESDPKYVAALQNPTWGTHIPALDDQSFARLRYVSFTYRFPANVARKFLGASNVAFTARARNLATLTGWHGLDPEAAFVGFSADPRHGRWEWSDTPQPLAIEGTLRLRF